MSLLRKMLLCTGFYVAGVAAALSYSHGERVELSSQINNSVYVTRVEPINSSVVTDSPIISAARTSSKLPRNQYSTKRSNPKPGVRNNSVPKSGKKSAPIYQPWQLQKIKQLGIPLPNGECYMYSMPKDSGDSREMIPIEDMLFRIAYFDVHGMLVKVYKGLGTDSMFPAKGCRPLDSMDPLNDPELPEEYAKVLQFREQYGDSL